MQYFRQVLEDRSKAEEEKRDVVDASGQEVFESACSGLDRLCVVAFLDTVKEGRFR